MTATRERLMQLLLETGAFKHSPDPVFKLASGATSRFYVDCRIALSYAEARAIVGEMILDRAEPRPDAVGGLLVGAFPVAIAVSDAAYRRGAPDIRVFAVRKEPKGHGMRKLVEGAVSEGDRVLIVDDVITSGQSTLDAIERSRDAGLNVSQVIVIIDRQEQDGRRRIEERGGKVDALCTLSDLKQLVGAES